MYLKYAAAALTAVLPLCSAQTYSDCNPTKSMFFIIIEEGIANVYRILPP